ncbi:MAG: tyrosine--tRNA ligase [Candidatus Kapabacteria bacterium]|jgi:tyrosyl-tRNA synthetase|nr:tyrosine--tRNA ligase [Candidatus Kapabacteria bacterium]
MFPTLNEQMDLIRSGVHELLPEEELAQKIERSLKTQKPLHIKLGCDPSRPDLHLGHAVVLSKMRQFQDLGHLAILLIGDFTGMIGDPTGRSKTRPALTLEETRENGQSYIEQATHVLSKDRLKLVYNSEWLGTMSFTDVVALTAKFTVAQMLERDDFSKRYKAGEPISIHEFLYPLAQGYDSVALEADVELGGTDQKFNLLVGRELQRAYGKEPQCILTMPILEGTDGVEKMSKSLGNYIGLTDSPREMFGKTMSIPDTLISRYFRYGAFALDAAVKQMESGLQDGTLHPRNAKVQTAMAIVARYHGEAAGQAAFEEFERMFVKKDLPDEIESVALPLEAVVMPIVDVLALANLAPSKSEARRLIQGGGVSVDGERVSDVAATADFSTERLLKVGKRKFLKIRKD